MSNPIPGANGPKHFECWGEVKTAKEWVGDPRCGHSSPREIVRRIRNGWRIDRAICQPLQTEIPKQSKYRKGRGTKVKAWGLEKNISQWAREPFVQVSKATLTRRISNGWDAESALIAKPHESPESAKKRTQTPPWRMSLGDYILLSLRGKLNL